MKLKSVNCEKEIKILRRIRIKQSLLVSCAFLIILTITVYQSYAIFDQNSNHNVIDEIVGDFVDIKILGYYVDGVQQDTMPAKGTKNFLKATCTNEAAVSFDSKNWSAILKTTGTSKADCFLYFGDDEYCSFNKITNLKDCILAKEGGVSSILIKGTPNFADIATTDEGMYAAADDYGTSYYYRGAVTNNNVMFAGFAWKIIRINGDGSIRLIYNGTSATNTTGSGTQISNDGGTTTTYAWNANNNDNKYVGYMYGGAIDSASTSYTGATTNEISNNAKTQIDTWYNTNISESNRTTVVDTIFCNNRTREISSSLTGDTGLGYGTNITAYERNRLYDNKNPELKCSQKNDRFTVSDTAKGNGSLTYPVGLITADEVSLAGGTFGINNNAYYLYTNQNYWTMSPYSFFNSRAIQWYVTSTARPNGSSVHLTYGLRPVIALNSSVVISGGNGTSTSPYIVSD